MKDIRLKGKKQLPGAEKQQRNTGNSPDFYYRMYLFNFQVYFVI